MTKEQCLTCGEWFEDSELDAHLSEHLKDEPESEEQVEQLPLKSPLRQGAEFDREALHSTKYSPEETLSKADMHLRASGYSVRVQGSTLRALHRPSGSLFGLVLVLVASILNVLFLIHFVLTLFFLPIYIILWFTRWRNTIVITVTGGNDDRTGWFAIQYDGSKAIRDAEQLSNMLQG